ncbi:MAG: hypothetical protein WD827_02760 [Solirubrobacterales bacterium]
MALAGSIAAPLSSAQIIGPQDPNDPKVDSPWQAGTCKADPPLPQCSVATPELFYEEAAGHPPKGFTQFIINSEAGPAPGTEVPIGDLKTVRVDLPAGLTVNPQATPQCDLTPEPPSETEKSPDSTTCPADTQVGVSEVTAVHTDTGVSVVVPPVPVYNLVPKHGEPARFGLSIAGSDVFLEADVAWESDYHEYFTIHVHKIALPGLGEKARVAKNRLVFDGMSGEGTYITTPTTCLGPAAPETPFEHVYSTYLRADSFQEENPTFPDGSEFIESKIPRMPPTFETSPKDCPDIPFEPSIGTEPNTAQTDSPSGATVTVNLPEIKNLTKDEQSKSTSHVRSARVTLPLGMGLNPSAATGLVACTDAQFGKGTRAPVACPEASRVGTVEVDTPPLPDGSLTGPVYVGQQLSRDPASGEAYRIFVDVESSRYDISARLLGKVRADPQTAQLTTTFDDGALGSVPIPGLPQVPFEAFKVTFNGGPKAPLTSPPTCGPNTTATQMTPWSSALGTVPVGEPGGPSGDPPATASGDFELTNLPGGGACPKTLAERPFAPSVAAKTANPQAGAFSEFSLEIGRQDGEQELKGAALDLPPGVTAKLAGVTYCPEAAIAAAAANSGASEAATPSCPASSLIGSASVLSGTGPAPLSIAGKAFLAGPFDGAPLSMVVVTPATAGPFDLGAVVVRVALFVDPETARIRATTNSIPHVYGGALLDIRSVVVRTDRPEFSLNPTNCSQLAVGGALKGGGANPLDPAAFSSVPVSAPFQVSGCEKLGFKPRLSLSLAGPMRRAGNPRLRAVFVPRPGDANPARVAVTLPHALFLDQASISQVCTRVQFAAKACPAKSIYGYAQAYSPLLDAPLKGPVYLRSSDNLLPDLVSALRGQVDITLVGRTDTVRERIRNTFDVIPDVPVSKFILTLRGGKRGLLENSRDLCPRGGKGSTKPKANLSRGSRQRKKSLRAIVRMKGQNGKKAKARVKLRRSCGQSNRKAKRGHQN